MGKKSTIGFGFFLLCWSTACGSKMDPVQLGDDDNATPTATTEVVGYDVRDSHVAPLLGEHCTGCHASNVLGADRIGAPASVNLDTYDDASIHAERSNIRIQDGTMPPGGALAQSDKDVFQAWIDQGTPR